MPPMHRPARSPVLFLLLLTGLLAACRDGKGSATFIPIAVSSSGNHGCNGPNNAFVSPELTYTDAARIGAMSQMAALAPPADPNDPLLDRIYVSGADTSILELDFTADPRVPAVTVVLPAGFIDTLLAANFTPTPPAQISGIAVLDPSNLLVVEHTSNTILLVNLIQPTTPNSVVVAVGRPDPIPSFVDGLSGASRFSFPPGVPTQIVPTDDLRIFVADRGNHAIRSVQLGQTIVVQTVSGSGIPFHQNGALSQTGFDTPAGVNVNCAGELLVSEVGPMGHRLRALQIGAEQFFGGASGVSMTLAGDGTPATAEGVAGAASVDAPVSPVTSSLGEVYWVDSGTGVLRRMVLASGMVDCPNPDFADCAAAVGGGGGFSGTGNYATAITASGYLYVLDGTAGTVSLVSNAP